MVDVMDELRKLFQDTIREHHNSTSENADPRDRERSMNNEKENSR